jgi:RNA polymerase sigma factor (TIGR02999 family)
LVERADHTLQATAIVHEAYLRLQRQDAERWQDRSHFLAIAAMTMRRVLVDHARRHGRKPLQRRDPMEPVVDPAAALTVAELLALNETLDELAEHSERKAKVVELHFFGGLSFDECATQLGVGRRTVFDDWAYARAWLHRRLARDPSTDRLDGSSGD